MNQVKPVHHFLKGMQLAIPIMLGYIPIAISFGVLATHYQFYMLSAVLMSATVFAGASQFLAVEMSATETILEISFVVFLINLRHFVMTYSLLPLLKKFSLLKRLILFSGITDETYALISFSKEKSLKTFSGLAGLILTAYLSWVVGTAIGVWFASFIPAVINNSMGIALYALFVALLVQALVQEPQYIPLAALTIFSNVGLNQILNATVALFISITIIPLFYVVLNTKRQA